VLGIKIFSRPPQAPTNVRNLPPNLPSEMIPQVEGSTTIKN